MLKLNLYKPKGLCTNPAHIGVSEWHYFVTNLVFEEADGTKIDCYMNIDVKQNEAGNWFYSFAIEKGTAPRTLLAGVTEKSATVPTKSISQNPKKSTKTSKKVSTNSGDRKALPDTDSEGNAISANEREYFANSKVVI